MPDGDLELEAITMAGTEEESNLHWADYVVIVGYFLAVLAVKNSEKNNFPQKCQEDFSRLELSPPWRASEILLTDIFSPADQWTGFP